MIHLMKTAAASPQQNIGKAIHKVIKFLILPAAVVISKVLRSNWIILFPLNGSGNRRMGGGRIVLEGSK